MQKGQRPKRKVVLFLVEGKTDIKALSLGISAIYEEIDPEIEVFFPTIVEDGSNTGGDITSRNGITPTNIEGCINKLFLEPFYQEKKLYPKDITEIVQIVDLDGAFVPNDCIITGDNPNEKDKPFYSNENIITNNVAHIIERNEKKQSILAVLTSLKNLRTRSKTPSYSIYYFSSNLDHFLYGNANLLVKEKHENAEKFSLDTSLDINTFVETIKKTPGALLDMTFEESWDFIKDGTNSLKRHSNINILLDKLLGQIK